MYYTVIEPNITIGNDSRPIKAKKRNTLYRDSKLKHHRTYHGKGIIGSLMRKK